MNLSFFARQHDHLCVAPSLLLCGSYNGNANKLLEELECFTHSSEKLVFTIKL